MSSRGQEASLVVAALIEATFSGARIAARARGLNLGVMIAGIGHHLLGYADALGHVDKPGSAERLRADARALFEQERPSEVGSADTN